MISERAHAECVRLLDLLTNKRVQESWSWVFMTPVTNIPGYDEIIKKPMDLGTVKKHLGSKPSRCRFKSHDKFARDVRLVFHNAMVYNKDDQHVRGSVFDAAQHLLRVFETAYAKAIETVFKAEDAASSDAIDEHEPSSSDKAPASGESQRHERDAGDGDDADGGGHRSSHHKSSHHKKSHKKESKKKHKKESKKKSSSKDKDRSDKKKDKHKSSSSSKDKDRTRSDKHDASDASAAPKAPSADASSVRASSSKDASKSSSRRPETAPPSAPPAPPAALPSPPAPPAPVAAPATDKMSDSAIHACLGVLMKLIKYKEGNVSPAAPFLQPVELSHFPDYRIKVPSRMHLYGVQKKLRNGGYATMTAFAYDVRLVFSNCLIYNSDVVLSKVMRSHAVTLMKLFEALFEKIGGHWPGVQERWKCHAILHEILAARTSDGQETAQWFKYPIQTYFDSPDQIPYGYYKKIKVPMDIGTVSARLHLGEYTTVRAFVKDVKLIFDNCLRYWKPDPQGQTYCESARALTHLLKTQVDHVFGPALSDELHLKDKHKSSSSSSTTTSSTLPTSAAIVSSGSSKTHRSSTVSTISTDDKSSKRKSSKSSNLSTAVPKDMCLGIMKQLRAHKMKGYRGIDIPTAGPFLHAVDTTKYPDYLTIISEPMDFAKIERKLKGDRYGSTDEFSADVHLIFSNCHKYNSDPVEGADIRAMASSLRDYFVELYTEKLGHADSSSSSSVATKAADVVKVPPAPVVSKPAPSKHDAVATAASSSAVDTAAKNVKAPSRSPTKRSSSDSSARESKKPHAPVASSSSLSVKLESAAAPSVKDAVAVKEPAIASSSRPVTTATAPAPVPIKTKMEASAPVASASSASGGSKTEATTVLDADELKRRKERKERKKEKKEKKEKKRKSREKDKDKKAKKKERKDKSDDRRRSDSITSAPPPLATASVSTSATATPVKAPLLPAPPAAAPIAAAKSTTVGDVPRTAASSSSSSSTKKSSSSSSSKKSGSSSSKKSDLSAWEASCDRVLNRLQRIEQVAKLHFDQPLLEVFPQLQTEYARLIREPMDLRTLREQLHAHALATDADFVRKGRLIFQNAIAFNCASDAASLHVREMSSHLMWYFDALCAELQLRGPETASAADAKAKQTQLRRERAALVAHVPMDLKPKECLKLLRVLNSQKYDRNCWPFRKPVRVLFPTLGPEYFDVIREPMDLATIADKVAALEYKVHGDFMRDVRLTFENAIAYNKADKDRDGWSVYAAAVHMLSVAEDLWSDVTLEVTERLRRKDMLRKERERLGESHKKLKTSDKHKDRVRVADASSDVKRAATSATPATPAVPSSSSLSAVKHALKASSDKVRAAAAASTASTTAPTSVLAAATIVAPAVPGSAARDGAGDVSATRLKLSIVNRSAPPSASGATASSGLNVDRMNKSERKAEEKRRKRARREEEIARSEKRRRTAVAATDDALREAEARSRRKLQKLEIAEAMKLREEREQRMRDAEAERALGLKMKFNAAMWSGALASASSSGFWSRKRVKLTPPAAFAAVATPIGSC